MIICDIGFFVSKMSLVIIYRVLCKINIFLLSDLDMILVCLQTTILCYIKSVRTDYRHKRSNSHKTHNALAQPQTRNRAVVVQ